MYVCSRVVLVKLVVRSTRGCKPLSVGRDAWGLAVGGTSLSAPLRLMEWGGRGVVHVLCVVKQVVCLCPFLYAYHMVDAGRIFRDVVGVSVIAMLFVCFLCYVFSPCPLGPSTHGCSGCSISGVAAHY